MKKLIFLGLSFAGLAAFVYFYEIAGREERDKAKEREESLFRLEEEQIVGFEVIRQGAPTIRLQKEGENWMLQAPINTAADKSAVSSLLQSVTGARRSRTFQDGTEQASDYGLAEPVVRLKVTSEEDEKELWIGNKDFTGSEMYVQFAGGSEVFVTSSLLRGSVEKEVKDWRDKGILAFDRSKIREIRIQRPSGEIYLEKQDDHWSLEEPIKERADEGTVSSLLSTLGSGEAQEFVAEEPESLTQYGLASPVLSVRVREEGQDTWNQMELGGKTGEVYFARNLLRPTVFTVKEAVFNELAAKLWKFRDKEVVDVAQDQIARLALKRNEETEIVIRHEEYKWIIESPEAQKDKEALSYKFWYPIDDLQFESIDDPAHSFPAPDIQLVLDLKDGSSRTYEFVRVAELCRARQVETGRHGTIKSEDCKKLEFKVEDITE